LIDPARKLDGERDLLIRDGRVERVGKGLSDAGAETVELKGLWVTPGFIDLHVHFRTPGQTHKETIGSGARSAVAGGFTTVCTMANTEPPIDSVPLLEHIQAEAARVGLLNILPLAALTLGLRGETLTEMEGLRKAGAVGFSDDGMPVMRAAVMRRALEYSRGIGVPVVSHCEDKSLSEKGIVHEGVVSARCGLQGIPAESETVMIARDLLLAESTGGHLHVAHVSTAAGVAMIRAAKARGVRVTAEVTPHHLMLTDEAVAGFDSRFKMNPPLRTGNDQAALWEGLRDGTLDAVATDHAPHATAEKEAELEHAPFGVVGLETAFPVLYTRGVLEKRLELPALVAALTCRPAAVLGIQRGTLAEGAIADLTVIDPTIRWTVEPVRFESKGKNSPFAGWELRGQVRDVWVAGRPVLRDRKILLQNGETA